MKTRVLYVGMMTVVLTALPVAVACQASAGSLAEFMKKQNDGIAESVRLSQERARTSKLVIGIPAGTKIAPGTAPSATVRPAVIRIGVHARQTGHDNRRQNNVR